MPNPLTPLKSTLDLAFLADSLLATLIRGLPHIGLSMITRPLVKLIRLRRGDDPLRGEAKPGRQLAAPMGPFRLAAPDQAGDLLLFVTRSLESILIDDATGGYGYSHAAVDCGEVDLATGKRVFVEATPGAGVHRSYLDQYGRREFIRIALAQAGADARAFRQCVLEKVGQPYDVAEALTWGQVDDPAKQVCSDLAADCLPNSMRLDLVRQARRGRLGRRAVSIHGPANLPLHIFVSPNGFARFFGAPHGHTIDHPDERVAPRARRSGIARAGLSLATGVGLAAGLFIVWKVWRRSRPYNTNKP